MEIEKSKSASYAIVIISSDEDDDEDVEKLFEAFVSKAEMFVAKKECIVLLRVKFAEARVEFVSSAKFKNSLKWRTDKVDESNAYILTKEIFNLLASDVKGGQSKSKSSVTEDERDNRDCFAGNEEVTKHSTGEETGQTQCIISVTTKGNDDLKGFKLESHQPSTSSASYSTNGFTENKKTQKRERQEIVSINLDNSKIVLKLTTAKKKRIVRKLEEKLKHISERIKILNKSELSLDEMNMNDSTYIQECRLKDRFNKIWNKICRINGRAPDTGRVTEKEIKCPHTGFREIDRAVNRFLKKKRGRFPDRFDINNVIHETKKKHGLKIAPQVIKEITDEVFMYVGNKLQKRRRLDFTNNSGSFLTDCYSAGEDPAMTDSALLKKLEENKKVSKRALDDVFNKYAHYGRMKKQGSGNDSSSDSETSNPENNFEKEMTLSRLSVASDSVDEECDDFGLEMEGETDNDGQGHDSRSFPLNSNHELHSISNNSMEIGDSESDMEDFEIKRPQQTTKDAPAPEKDTDVALPFSEANSAIIELPSSMLCEVIDVVTVEQTNVREVSEACVDKCKSSSQHFNTGPTEDGSTHDDTHDDKQAVTGDHERASVHGSPQCLSMAEQNSASRKNSDLNKENGDTVTAELSPDSTSTAVNDLLTDAVCSSSNVQHIVRDDEVHTKEYLEKTAKQQMKDSIPSGSEKYSHNPNSMKEYGEDCKSSLTSPQIKKRKAEIGLSEYQSPLKALCKGISRHHEEEKESYKTFAKSSTAENALPSTNSLPTTPNNVSPNHAKREKKFSLSLNKNGQHSPRTKSVCENKFDVIIVLSDDDDDEGNG